MKLQMQSIHFTAASALKEYTREKVEKLEHFYDRIIEGEVFFKLQNEVKEANKRVEVKIHVPGETLIASEQGQSFEEAVDLVSDKLRRQLLKYKGKQQAHH